MKPSKTFFILVISFVILSLLTFFFFNDITVWILPRKEISVPIDVIKNNNQHTLDIFVNSTLETIEVTENPLLSLEVLFSYKDVLEQRGITKIQISFVSYEDHKTAYNLQLSDSYTTQTNEDDYIVGYDVNYPGNADLLEIIIAVNEKHPMIINRQTNLSDLVSKRIFYALSLFDINKQISSVEESEKNGRDKYSSMILRYQSYPVSITYK